MSADQPSVSHSSVKGFVRVDEPPRAGVKEVCVFATSFVTRVPSMTGRGLGARRLQLRRRRAWILRRNRRHQVCSKCWKGIRCSRFAHRDPAAGHATRTMARVFVRRVRRFPRPPAIGFGREHDARARHRVGFGIVVTYRDPEPSADIGQCRRTDPPLRTGELHGAGKPRWRRTQPVPAQQASRTLRSNGALWAATKAASVIQARSVGHNSAKVGASRTSSHRRP